MNNNEQQSTTINKQQSTTTNNQASTTINNNKNNNNKQTNNKQQQSTNNQQEQEEQAQQQPNPHNGKSCGCRQISGTLRSTSNEQHITNNKLPHITTEAANKNGANASPPAELSISLFGQLATSVEFSALPVAWQQ